MDIPHRYPSVHWIWGGGISFVYEVHPRIVVKVPKSGEFERQQFQKELKIYQIFSQNPPCPSIVQCFLLSGSGIFLEYMRDNSLFSRIQNNHTEDQQTRVVIIVEKLEPLSLRLEWMNDLAQAVAFLESLNLAHGDLRPENILLDRNRLKLSDFDCTAKIGSKYEACMAPYGRILNHEESDQGECGNFGLLGPRTEQFALGSLYYLLNYGYEVYSDRCLADDPYDHGPKVVDLLQNMKFPKLDGNTLIDNIIDKCWHNKYVKVSELAAHTRALLSERTDTMESSGVANLVKTMPNEPKRATGDDGDNRDVVDQPCLEEDLLSKKEFCQDLEKRGLLDALSSGEPREIGFTFEWYRHSLSG